MSFINKKNKTENFLKGKVGKMNILANSLKFIISHKYSSPDNKKNTRITINIYTNLCHFKKKKNFLRGKVGKMNILNLLSKKIN